MLLREKPNSGTKKRNFLKENSFEIFILFHLFKGLHRMTGQKVRFWTRSTESHNDIFFLKIDHEFFRVIGPKYA